MKTKKKSPKSLSEDIRASKDLLLLQKSAFMKIMKQLAVVETNVNELENARK
jgi:hypothetical protein